MNSCELTIDMVNEWNERTFRQLYKTYYKVLVVYAIQITNDNVTSEDHVQDIFSRLYENKPHFDNIHTLRAYLYNSVRNDSLDYLRHKNVESSYLAKMMQEHVGYELGDNGDEMFFKEEFYRHLAEAINNLPQRQHDIFMLYLNGKKNEEIAKILNISVGTIKTHRKRGMAAIKKNIGEPGIIFFFVTLGL